MRVLNTKNVNGYSNGIVFAILNNGPFTILQVANVDLIGENQLQRELNITNFTNIHPTLYINGFDKYELYIQVCSVNKIFVWNHCKFLTVCNGFCNNGVWEYFDADLKYKTATITNNHPSFYVGNNWPRKCVRKP